jgi:hypothetical protein
VDSCVEEAASLPLEWSEYREQGTEFRKASTKPESILEQLRKVYNMTDEERAKMGKQARKWVLLNFDTPVIGKQICDFVDDAPFVDESVFEEGEEEEINPYIPIDNSIKEDKQWLTEAYHKILNMTHVDEDDDGHKYWMELLESKKNSRKDVESYFRQTAIDNKNKKILRISDDKFSSHLDEDDEGKRIIMVIPKDAGDVYLATSLLPSINRLYPDYNLYFACEDKFKDIILGNPHVHKWVPFCQSMEQGVWLEGSGNHKGWFEVAYVPFLITQQNLSSWLHNDKKDKLDLELCTY